MLNLNQAFPMPQRRRLRSSGLQEVILLAGAGSGIGNTNHQLESQRLSNYGVSVSVPGQKVVPCHWSRTLVSRKGC